MLMSGLLCNGAISKLGLFLVTINASYTKPFMLCFLDLFLIKNNFLDQRFSTGVSRKLRVTPRSVLQHKRISYPIIPIP